MRDPKGPGGDGDAAGESVLLFCHFWEVASTIRIADDALVGTNCVVPVTLALTMMP